MFRVSGVVSFSLYTGAYIDFTVWGDDTHPRVYPRDIDYTQGKGASTPVFWMHNATTRPWEWRGQSPSLAPCSALSHSFFVCCGG